MIPKGTREEIVEATLQHSPLWQHVEVHCLRENVRLRQSDGADEFAQWLLDIGHGRAPSLPNCPPTTIAIPENMVCGDVSELIRAIYGDISTTG